MAPTKAHHAPRTWLITGADKGLGQSTAKAALEQGDNVVVTLLDRGAQHSLAKQHPNRFRAFHLDARHLERVAPVVQAAAEAFGRIDVLVNNAGYGLMALAEETPPEKYRPLFEVNFFGLVEMTRAVLPVMRRQKAGHIINLSSVGGFEASPGFSFYSATKFAVEGWSESLSKEVKHLGIRVSIIEPGGFRSDFAGPSLVSVVAGATDYAPITRFIDDYVRTRHGTQANDPAKFGPALCRLVELADPPLRLPLGPDGLQGVRRKLAAVAAEVDLHESLALSTAFDK